MSNKPMFICITGVDGVGKTTHVNMVIDHLQKQGVKCEYRWLRFHHLLSLPLLLFCRLTGYTRVSTLGGKQKCSYHEFYRSGFISTIYPWLLFVDTVIYTIIKVYVPMLVGTTIVCDRFVYDTLIDLSVDTKNYKIYDRFVGRLFLKMIPKNAKFVIITLDKQTILMRRPELNDDVTFDERYDLYNRYKDIFRINVITNDGTISDVNNLILASMRV